MDFEIFKTGTHTSDVGITKDYNIDDLHFIAENYNPESHEAPIVVGHPKLDSPAMGWIQSLKVAGDKLIATSKEIIPEFLDALKQGLYKKRSISLDKDGKLRHVGFLGGAVPAVKGLANIQFAEGDYSTFELDNDSLLNDSDLPNTQDEKPNVVEENPELLVSITAQLVEIKNTINTLSQNFSEQSESKSDISKIYTQINSINNKINNDTFYKHLDNKISSGTLTPAMKSKIVSVVDYLQTQNFSESDNQKIVDDLLSLLKELVDSVPRLINFQNFAEKETDSNKNTRDEFSNMHVDELSSSMHKKVIKIMQSGNISYLQAVNKLIQNNSIN